MIRKLKNHFHLLESILAAVYYRFPGRRLIVIGVTGTDGKTTTTNLIHHVLTVAGYKAGISSTLDSPHMTTPGRWRLQQFLARCLENKCTHAVLEISSFAIDQNRIWGIPFKVGVLTNIANNEHLDYHKTFEHYKNTKLKFLKSCEVAVDWQKLKNFRFETQLVGKFNQENCLAAIAVAKALDIDDEVIRKAIAGFKPLPGRLEVVHRRPLVIVDFAHTPQAFEKVLPVVKKLGKRLIHVFGCTGCRDKSKRPIMGQIASKYDDEIILTHEDTYTENPEKIIDQIASGINRRSGLSRISNRREAIAKALALAKTDDVVFISGVGHQKSLNLAGREVPWSDQKVVQELLNYARKS